MPKRFFRRLAPARHTVEGQYKFEFIRRYFSEPNLWRTNRRTTAKGIAVGLFCAFIPIPLTQMIVAALLAVRFHANLPLALVFTWLTNPLTILPMLYLCNMIGVFLMPSFDQPVELTPNLIELWNSLGAQIAPIALGWVTLCAIITPLGYFSVMYLWRAHVLSKFRNRHRK